MSADVDPRPGLDRDGEEQRIDRQADAAADLDGQLVAGDEPLVEAAAFALQQRHAQNVHGRKVGVGRSRARGRPG